MKNTAKQSNKVAVSEKMLQKTAALLLPQKARLVSTEILYIQRILGASATQIDIDEKVVAVRKMPWASIAPAE